MVTRVYIDTEFIDNGRKLDLISIALVTANGQFYAVSSEFDASQADDWVKANVLAKLPDFIIPRTRAEIRDGIEKFLEGKMPEFWGYFASYDFVLLCQLWGKMIDLPKGWPKYIHDLKCEADRKGVRINRADDATAHDAHLDARWIMEQHEKIQ